VVLVLVVAVLVVSYASSMRAYLDQQSHLDQLRESIASSQANIDQLQREKRRWKDPAYLEAEAHRRLGWVMPGEVGYQVIGVDGEPLSADDDSLSDPDAVDDVDEPEWWQTAWGTMEAAGNPEDVPNPVEQIGHLKKKQKH
jgi:hypothetical protein